MGIGYQREIDNNPQSQVQPPFRFFLTEYLKEDITLTSKVSLGDEVINVSAGHGFTGSDSDNEIIIIWSPYYYLQSRVTGVSTNAISVENPAIHEFSVEGSVVIRGNIGMNVDGSSSPRLFKMDMKNFIVPIDIATAKIKIYSGALEPDDGKFGGDTGIVNKPEGLHMYRTGDNLNYNFGNYCNNGDFRDTGAEVEYTQKAPAGTYATIVTWDLIDIFTQEVRFDPRANDKFFANIRGDLSDNAFMYFILMGSYTSGE